MSPERHRLGDGWRLALGTLTRLPVPAPRRVDRPTAAAAMLLSPVVALAPAALVVLALLVALLRPGIAPVAAVLAVAAMALLTGGLHLDGLADTADGLAAAGKHGRERGLAVMREGDTGPAAVTAVALVLLLDVAALAALPGLALDVAPASAGGASVPATVVAVVVGVPVVLSRTVLPWACLTVLPAARRDGLGVGVAGTVAPWRATLVSLVVLVAAAGGHLLLGVPLAGLVGAVLGATLPVAWLLARARTRLGGVTGDVLGAAVELALAGALAGTAVGLALALG